MGKHNIPMTRRSHSAGGISLTRRPKRNVAIKTYDDTVGLSRTEERELKKALYASLQESKRLFRYQQECYQHESRERPVSQSSQSALAQRPSRPMRSRSWPHTPSQTSTATPSTNASVDESSQDSVKSSVSSMAELKNKQERKIHAQRKFAQGSLPPTPSTTPVKVKASPIKLLPKTAKTEDFLTFLCLRGSSVLPPHLDFFNFSRGEPSHGEINPPQTPPPSEPSTKQSERTRESTPESSSVSTNDELYEIGTPSPSSLIIVNGRNGLSARKAARASASTPETARGIVSLSQGLTKKTTRVSTPHRGRKYGTVEKTPSPRKGSLVRGQLTPSKRGFAVKSLSPQFSKTAQEKKLSLKQKALLSFLPRKTSTKLGTSSGKAAGSKQLMLEGTEQGSQPSHQTFKPVNPASHKRSTAAASKHLKAKLKKKKELTKQKLSGKVKKKVFLKGKLKPKSKSGKRQKGSLEEHPRKKRIVRRSSLRLKELTKALKAQRKRRRRPVEEEEEEDEVTISLHPPSRPVGKRRNFAPRPIGGEVTEMPRAVTEEFDFEIFTDDEDDEVSFGNISSFRRTFGSKKSAREKTKKVKPRKVGMNTRSSSQKTQTSAAKIVATKCLSAVKKLRAPKKDQIKLSKIIERRRKLKQDDMKGDAARRGRKPAAAVKKSITPEKPNRSDPLLKSDQPSLLEVPTFRPTEEEFRDPIQYIESIREKAEPFGMCQIIPPSSWKCESKINDEMRFTAQVQHVHRLYKRWGPNVQITSSISKHLDSIGADLEPHPQIGGVEVDLCKLSQTIHEFGGMQNNVDKKKWVKIADAMKIPKLAQDRGMRLYDVYCKYLLPYDTLSAEERSRIEQSVISDRQKKVKAGKVDDDEAIVKGKSNPLSTFIRVARNVRSMWFKDEPTPEYVESEYWKLLEDRTNHVAVQCGHVSTSTQGSGFPSKKDSPYSRHGWNLNNLSENPKCILRCLGPVSGATIPTLHIGMLFATSCWCTDIHHLPYIQYLHTGVDIVWYSIPKQQENKFKAAMKDMVPSLISEDPRWLKEDTVMVNPAHLTARGVTVARCVQKPKTFVAIFPKSYTATISCGYNVSESVHYATRRWISAGVSVAEDLSKSVEPELFSMDALLSHLIFDPTTDIQTLKVAVPFFERVLSRELSQRKQLMDAGLKPSKRGGMSDDMPSTPSRKRSIDQVEENVCDVSKKHCFFSRVVNESENLTLSLEEGLKHVQKKKNLKHCRLNFRYTEEELKSMLQSAQCRLDICGSSSSDGGSGGKKRGMKK